MNFHHAGVFRLPLIPASVRLDLGLREEELGDPFPPLVHSCL